MKYCSSIIGIFILFAPIVYATDMCVSDAGTLAVNGTYVESGTAQGKPYYLKSPYEIFFWSASPTWYLAEGNTQTSNDASVYHSFDNVATPDLITTWSNGTGADPDPTITSGACGGEPEPTPTASTTLSTTTVMYADWIFVNGVIIALLSFVPVGIIFNLFRQKYHG